MKKILTFTLFFLFVFSVYGADGLLWGEKDIRVAKTEWFDIIYPERDEVSAKLLFENADRIYYEIAQDYGFPPQARMPVVLAPSVEQCNAFWSWMPYNHIVIYNTESIEQLEYFSDKLLSTFRHELTHAYTYNMENKFWKGVSSVFGDAVVLGRVFTTLGMAESATLTSESRNGEGRLNDEYSKQMVRQAKLEGKFPKYFDMQGNATNYPAGSFYYFNGAFAQWLQDTYGMEKYALYWYKCINFQTLTPGMAFKNAFGETFTSAWEKFENSVEVPDISGNPVKEGTVQDFFEKTKNDYSGLNNAGAVYTSVSASDIGFIYVDDRTDSVYFVDSESYDKDSVKPKKLFYKQGLDNAAISKDGQLVVFSYFDNAAPNVKHKIGLYSQKTKQFFYINESNSFKPAIVMKDNDYFLLSVNFCAGESNISISKINFNKARITSVTLIKQHSFELNETINYFTDIGNGEFAFVKSSGINPFICKWNLEGEEIAKYEMPFEGMNVRYLESCEEGLNFSWVKPGVMPRFGKLNLETNEFILSEQDISGGVYYPVESKDSKKIVYVGKFFRENRILMTAGEIFENNSLVLKVESKSKDFVSDETGAAVLTSREVVENKNFISKPYNPFSYLSKGVWLPVSIVSSDSYAAESLGSVSLPFGLTHITGTPWFNTSGLLITSLGYGLLENTLGLDVSYRGGTDTSLFLYTAELKSEIDFTGRKDIQGSLDITSTIPFGTCSRISFAVNSITHFENLEKYNANYLISSSGIAAGYGYLWKTGSGRFEKAGFTLSANVSYLYYGRFANQNDILKNEINAGGVLRVYLPKLLPLTCKNGICYNLPLSLSAHFYPSSFDSALGGNNIVYSALTDISSADILYSLNAEVILLAVDVQKGVWITPLFVNDFRISLAYTGVFIDPAVKTSSWKFLRTGEYIQKIITGEVKYLDALKLKTVVGLCPNFGASANSNFKTDFFAEFTVRQSSSGLYYGLCTLGIDLGF